MPPAEAPTSPLDGLIVSSLLLQDRTKELYRACVADFVEFAGPDPSAYTPALVEQWLHSLLESRQPQTVNVFRKALRFASKRWVKLQAAGEQRVDFANSADRVKTQKSTPRAPLTYEEAGKLINACSGDELIDVRDRALLVVALRTGLRRGGLAALTLDGIRPPKITTTNKGGGSITFVADAETLAELERWTRHVTAAGLTGIVFRRVKGNKIGDAMTPFQIWRAFNTRAKQAGVRHIFPHLARHSTITWLREAGTSSATIRNLTGQTERTIEDTYTHVRTDGAVGEALPSLLKKNSQ